MQPTTSLPDDGIVVDELPGTTQVVVAALIKHAFGAAVGVTLAVALAALAGLGIAGGPNDSAKRFVWLIGDSFLPLYGPSPTGVLFGVLWGFGLGYVIGFGAALARNRIIKFHFWMLNMRTRLAASRHVLDEIS